MTLLAAQRSWYTVMDIDFTSLGTISLTSNGNYNIGGYTWTKGNSTNDLTPAVIDSEGLKFNPTNSNTSYDSGRTLPYIWTPLTVFSDYSINVPISIWVYSTSNPVSEWDNVTVAVDDNSRNLGIEMSRGFFYGGQGGRSTFTQSNSSVSAGSHVYTLNTSNEVQVLEFPSGISSLIWNIYKGTYGSGDFPNFSNLQITHSCRATSISYNMNAVGSMGVLLGAQRWVSATSGFIAKYKRIKIKVKN